MIGEQPSTEQAELWVSGVRFRVSALYPAAEEASLILLKDSKKRISNDEKRNPIDFYEFKR